MLAPRIFEALKVSRCRATGSSNPVTGSCCASTSGSDHGVSHVPFSQYARETMQLPEHVKILEISLGLLTGEANCSHGADPVLGIDGGLDFFPNLVRIKLYFDDMAAGVPSSAVQRQLGAMLAHHPRKVAVDLLDVPAEHFDQLVDVELLARVENLVFEFKQRPATTTAMYQLPLNLNESIGRMTALRTLKHRPVRQLEADTNCFQAVAGLDALCAAIRALPALTQLDLGDITPIVATAMRGHDYNDGHAFAEALMRRAGANWLPRTVTALTCDWNLLPVLLATNAPERLRGTRELVVTMTRRFAMYDGVMQFGDAFTNLENLSLYRGPAPWTPDAPYELVAAVRAAAPRLHALRLRGLYSDQVAGMAHLFYGLETVQVLKIADDSYGLGDSGNSGGSGASSPRSGASSPTRRTMPDPMLSAANRILMFAGQSLRVLHMHATTRAQLLHYPLLESLLLDDNGPLAPLAYIIWNYEVTKMYPSASADPIDAGVFSGFNSRGRFSLREFCAPLRELATGRPVVFADRRSTQRFKWDPVVIDVRRLRVLLDRPERQRVAYQPLTGAVLFK
ncbi:hypothetical protein D0Z00_000283 [Geotrichum galactomycetum]|uniref:Uncharacterized protein n=1 Tax=Geotrichum galactomycetum TaxID=27317 RepID=A0ACB6VA50_9ASCO|nr:hypothetical protein D0Z00_000283 [Geotrichum candidum]